MAAFILGEQSCGKAHIQADWLVTYLHPLSKCKFFKVSQLGVKSLERIQQDIALAMCPTPQFT